MLTAKQEGALARLQDLIGLGLDIGKRLFCAAEAQLEVAHVQHVRILQVTVLIGTVRLDAKGLVADGRRAKPGARAE